MTSSVILTILLLALVGLTVGQRRYKQYPSSYEDIDIDGILNNRPLRNAYVACLMDRGSCSPEGQTLKDIIPMAVDDNCGKCTPKHHHFMNKMRRHFTMSGNPADVQIWNDIHSKYHIDPRKTG